jgi:hypothetical protein
MRVTNGGAEERVCFERPRSKYYGEAEPLQPFPTVTFPGPDFDGCTPVPEVRTTSSFERNS